MKKLLLCLSAFIFSVSLNAHYVTVNSTIPAQMGVVWNWSGNSDTKIIPAATEDKLASLKVNETLLHKGFSKVHTIDAQVGQVWGKNPETGEDLVFTQKMFTSPGVVWGIKPKIYWASAGQAVYHNFILTVVPYKNPQDNNNWWPRFVIDRLDPDVFAPIIKAFKPVKDFFQTVEEGGSLAIKILNALIKKRPLTGFQLSDKPDYLAKSAQPLPPTIAQEEAQLKEKLAQLDPDAVEQQAPLQEEIRIIEAIKKYSPIVYLHPEERAGPIAFTDFFAGESTMVREKNKQKKDPVVMARGTVTFKKLADLAERNPKTAYMIWHGQPKSPLTYDKRVFYGSNPTFYPDGIPIQVTTFYGSDSNQRIIEAELQSLIEATRNVQLIVAQRQMASTTQAIKQLALQEQQATREWITATNKAVETIKKIDPRWEQAVRDTLGQTALQTSLGHLRNLFRKAQHDASMTHKDFFYIQWLFLYGYNEPYTISTTLGTLFKGDYHDIQNAHEGDLEHITMKVNAQTNALVSIEYGAHGSAEGQWLYPPGTTDNRLKEFMVENGHPVVFVAQGSHGNYPREGVYTRVYGLANDVTQKGSRWPMTEQNIYRTVRPNSAGFNAALHDTNPNHGGYLDFNGFLGPRGVNSHKNQSWIVTSLF